MFDRFVDGIVCEGGKKVYYQLGQDQKELLATPTLNVEQKKNTN